MVFGTGTSRDEDPPTTINPFICLSIVDDEWKFKITPPASAPTAFGQTGQRQNAAPLGEEPKYKMELKLKRKLRCRCISVLAGNENSYDNDDLELDPSDVSKDCDSEGFRTMRDLTTRFVGYCGEAERGFYGLEKAQLPCKCNREVECEWVTEDLYDTFVNVTGGKLVGNSNSENRDDVTVGNLAKNCACMGARSPITSGDTILGYENTLILTKSGGCFDCVMDQLSCEHGSEGAGNIAMVMTQLLKDNQLYDSALDGVLCMIRDCDAGGPQAFCPPLNGFEVVG